MKRSAGRAPFALYHPADPAIQGLADNLKRLVEEFKVHVGTKPLSDADGRRLRIAEGLVANAERRDADALALVPEQDAATAFARARAQVEQAVKANQVRANAFYGLQRWRDALAYYQRILELRRTIAPRPCRRGIVFNLSDN